MTTFQSRFSNLICTGIWLFAPSAIAQVSPVVTSHQKAAQELYRLAGGNATAESGADAMLAAMTNNNPQLAEYEDVLRAW